MVAKIKGKIILLIYITKNKYSFYYLRAFLKPLVPSGPFGILTTLHVSGCLGFTIHILKKTFDLQIYKHLSTYYIANFTSIKK